jgi:hypothetical protein
MRLGLVLAAVVVWCSAWCGDAFAHAADEFPQVTVQVTVDDARVRVLSRVPAEHVSMRLFEGRTPIDLDRLEPADLAKEVEPLLAARCPLRIDGVVVPPRVVKAEMKMTGTRMPLRSFSMMQVLRRGYLIFMAEYETKGSPRRVDLDWTIFANEYDDAGEDVHDPADLSLVAITRGYGREEIAVLTPIEPGLTWHSDAAFALPAELLAVRPVQRNFMHLPVVSILFVLAGFACVAVTLRQSKPRAVALLTFSFAIAGLCLPYGNVAIEHTSSYARLDDDEAIAIFESLHRNIYRAFDYTHEGAVYDALAQSVDGPMLETIYNDVYQSLIMREENGAVSKVARVEVEAAEVNAIDEATRESHGSAAYAVACSWQVDGVVTHFGHSHERTNAFDAVYTVAPRAEGWRIVDVDILRQQRIDPGDTEPTPPELYNDP